LRKTLGMLMVLGLVVLVAGVAGANTIVVPFFNDGGSLAGTTAAGMRTYIRVKNLDAATITCAISYTDFNGVDATPSPNTFILLPKASVGFRPVQADEVAEGPGLSIPDAVPVGTFAGGPDGGGPAYGGAEISSTNNILGMVSQEDYFVGTPGGSGIAPMVSAP
jgi:hypothetical protein